MTNLLKVRIQILSLMSKLVFRTLRELGGGRVLAAHTQVGCF